MIILFIASHLMAAIPDLNPGQWQVETQIVSSDVLSEKEKKLDEALKNVPEERKARLRKILSTALNEKYGNKTASKKVCVSAKDKASALFISNSESCQQDFQQKNASLYTMKFRCKDGSLGKGTWKQVGQNAFSANMQVQGPEGKKSKIQYKAKLLSTQCQ
tara:strand:- start:1366 stop:1848 length:483 start_codon:yes stop_codon:yes gene_type:complete